MNICVPTFNGRAFRQYSDCSHCYILKLVDRAAFGPPAVRSNPQEMAHLIGSLGGIENSPARTFMFIRRKQKRHVQSNIYYTERQPALRSCLDITAISCTIFRFISLNLRRQLFCGYVFICYLKKTDIFPVCFPFSFTFTSTF